MTARGVCGSVWRELGMCWREYRAKKPEWVWQLIGCLTESAHVLSLKLWTSAFLVAHLGSQEEMRFIRWLWSANPAHKRALGEKRREFAGLLVYFSPYVPGNIKAVTWTNYGVKDQSKPNIQFAKLQYSNKIKYRTTEALILRMVFLTGFCVNALFHSSSRLGDASFLTLIWALHDRECDLLMGKKPGLWRQPAWLTVSLIPWPLLWPRTCHLTATTLAGSHYS